jgi:hypothetical protein
MRETLDLGLAIKMDAEEQANGRYEYHKKSLDEKLAQFGMTTKDIDDMRLAFAQLGVKNTTTAGPSK